MAESKGWIKFARNEFQIDNANYMKKLWVKQDFTDVTLVADDGLVRSHKVVLAAGSSVFQDLLGGVLRDQTCPLGCFINDTLQKKKMQYQYAPLTGVYKPDMKEFFS